MSIFIHLISNGVFVWKLFLRMKCKNSNKIYNTSSYRFNKRSLLTGWCFADFDEQRWKGCFSSRSRCLSLGGNTLLYSSWSFSVHKKITQCLDRWPCYKVGYSNFQFSAVSIQSLAFIFVLVRGVEHWRPWFSSAFSGLSYKFCRSLQFINWSRLYMHNF